jgi:CRISPR-associated protein Cas2
MTWLIAYDISCPRRWRRFYGLVRDYGVRVQWSVFVVTQAPFGKDRFLSAAARIIDPKADDIRLYRVTTAPGMDHTSGSPFPLLPPGVHWPALPPRAERAT